jgi:hypothetical protein
MTLHTLEKLWQKFTRDGIMKRIQPEVLIFGVVNGLYNSPFFLTRFRGFIPFFFAV